MTPTDPAAAKEALRDPRLDFFRGLGMFIILIAHIPWNSWKNWIPARFGYSDATEIFVFCSGAASAIAFLKIFNARGWWIGTMRIVFRIWQLYWCHIAVFFAILTTLILIDNTLTDANRSYVQTLNLKRFLNDPAAFLPALFTLRYVPNFFDILVMYMVILALIPVVVALSWKSKWLAMGFCVALWALVSQPWLVFLDVPVFTALNLPANPKGKFIDWFFNPFCWQLIFFTGFAFSVGWLPKPPVKWYLILLAIAVLIPSFWLDTDGVPARRLITAYPEQFGWITEWRTWHRETFGVVYSKTFFGLFRYIHFLALAYLVWIAAGDAGKRLPKSGLGGGIVTIVRRVGQQSLAVFIFSLWISWVLGAWISEMDPDGKGGEPVALWVIITANLAGMAAIISVAYIARYFRNPPWSRKTALATTGTPTT